MKNLFVIIGMLMATGSKAQMSTLFYDRPFSQHQLLADSILAVLPGYRQDTAYQTKSGKSFNIIISNKKATKVVINFSYYNSRIYLCNITGPYPALFTIYHQYLNDKPTSQQIENSNCAAVLLKPISYKLLPITFCSNGASWTISTKTPQ